MSYSNPSATNINTVGLDASISKLQTSLQTLTWLNKVFHRAYTHREIDLKDKTILIPKVWEENAQADLEWYDCRPNDIVISQAFFTPVSEERVIEWVPQADATWEQEIALIVWVNTTQLPAHDSGPSLGLQKAQVLQLLNTSPVVSGITSIVDRDATEIYRGFTIVDDITHYTMLPFAGFRINFKVLFDYIQCLQPSS